MIGVRKTLEKSCRDWPEANEVRLRGDAALGARADFDPTPVVGSTLTPVSPRPIVIDDFEQKQATRDE